MPNNNAKIKATVNRIIKKTKDGSRYTYQIKGKKDTEKTPKVYVPYLVLKNDENDIGSRPLENPSWAPPCIWVEQCTQGNQSGSIVVQPQTGQRYQIVAEVDNLGLATSYFTYVEFYWIDPSPSEPSESRIQIIGRPKMVTVPAGGRIIVRSDPWIPQYINEGHECIIVRTYDPLLDPVDFNQYSQVVDRHVGQRNVSVIQSVAGTNVFLSMNILPSMCSEEEITVSAKLMGAKELCSIMETHGIKGEIAKSSPIYSGLISRESLLNIHWKIKGFKIEEALKAFDSPLKRQRKIVRPFPSEIDSRFSQAILPALQFRIEKNQSKRIWLVQGIPYAVSKEEVFGITVTQWKGREIIGKMHHIVIVK